MNKQVNVSIVKDYLKKQNLTIDDRIPVADFLFMIKKLQPPPAGFDMPFVLVTTQISLSANSRLSFFDYLPLKCHDLECKSETEGQIHYLTPVQILSNILTYGNWCPNCAVKIEKKREEENLKLQEYVENGITLKDNISVNENDFIIHKNGNRITLTEGQEDVFQTNKSIRVGDVIQTIVDSDNIMPEDLDQSGKAPIQVVIKDEYNNDAMGLALENKKINTNITEMSQFEENRRELERAFRENDDSGLIDENENVTVVKQVIDHGDDVMSVLQKKDITNMKSNVKKAPSLNKQIALKPKHVKRLNTETHVSEPNVKNIEVPKEEDEIITTIEDDNTTAETQNQQ